MKALKDFFKQFEEQKAFLRCGIAILFSVGALILNDALRDFTERNLFFLSIAAITLSALMGGRLSGVLASLTSTAGLLYFFIAPQHSLDHLDASERLRIATFLGTGIGLSIIAGSLRRALDEARKAREVADEAVKSREEIMSIVGHELKTPLTAIQLKAGLGMRLASSNKSTCGEYSKLFSGIEHSLKRLNRVLEDLLDYSSAQHNKLGTHPETCDLKELTAKTVDLFREQARDQGFEIHLEAPVSVVGRYDPGRIEQVLTNLISNAIKYGDKKAIDVRLCRKDDTALLEVADQGAGISKTDQQKIFAKFKRVGSHSSIQGLGMGLFITKKIVELHGGRIWVESKVNQGTTFKVELPFS